MMSSKKRFLAPLLNKTMARFYAWVLPVKDEIWQSRICFHAGLYKRAKLIYDSGLHERKSDKWEKGVVGGVNMNVADCLRGLPADSNARGDPERFLCAFIAEYKNFHSFHVWDPLLISAVKTCQLERLCARHIATQKHLPSIPFSLFYSKMSRDRLNRTSILAFYEYQFSCLIIKYLKYLINVSSG